MQTSRARRARELQRSDERRQAHRRRAGRPRRCDVRLKALRRAIPHEGGDKAQWQRRLLRAGRKRAARSGKLPRPPKTGATVAPVFAVRLLDVAAPSSQLSILKKDGSSSHPTSNTTHWLLPIQFF